MKSSQQSFMLDSSAYRAANSISAKISGLVSPDPATAPDASPQEPTITKTTEAGAPLANQAHTASEVEDCKDKEERGDSQKMTAVRRVSQVLGPQPREANAAAIAISAVEDNDGDDDEEIVAVQLVADKQEAKYHDQEDDHDCNSFTITHNDVLFSNNDCYNRWPANLLLHEWIEKVRPAFMMARKCAEQTRIAREVVLAVQSQDPPGRFFEQDASTEEWSLLDETDIFVELGKVLHQPTISATHPYPHAALPHSGFLYAMAIPGASHHSDYFSAVSNLSYLVPIPHHHHTGPSPMATAQEGSTYAPQDKALRRGISLESPSLAQRRQRKLPMALTGAKRKQPAKASTSEAMGSFSHQRQLDGVASQTASHTPQQQLKPAATSMDVLPMAKAPRIEAAGNAPPPSLQRKNNSQSSKLLDATVGTRNFVARNKAVQSRQRTQSTKELPKGVTVRPSGKCQAQAFFCGQSRYIGVFDNVEEAALAYETVSKRLNVYRGGRNSGRPKLDQDQANKIFEGARRLAEETISERRKQRQKE